MSTTLIHTQRQTHSMTPSLITNRLHNICKHLTLGRQEDAHEFLRYLIEQMEKAYLNRHKGMPWFKDLDQYSKETTPLNQILGGYLRSTVTCLSCKHESITFQHFEDLSLDISRVSTLNEALGGYFARENLEECGYKCESCKKKVSATKRFTLERAPAVLCIQLKRFNVMGGKLGKPIQISQGLDLQKHLAKSSDLNQSCTYKLVSLVTHLGGSASGGHYTAIGLAPNGNYYHFDDSCVNPISTESVLRTNAYVLFYELVQSAKAKLNGNGYNSIHQNEHAYSKMAPSTSTTPTFDRGFAKPILPKTIIPISIMRQNQLKQKENETTPPMSRNGPSTSKATNGISKVSTQLFPPVKANGKREASDDEKEESSAKRMKTSLPSVPRITSDEEENATVKPARKAACEELSAPVIRTPSPTSPPPSKPKSLVPYETDDEDEEPTAAATGVSKKLEQDRVNFCRTSSGVFVETDLKENNTPSKQGSTIDKTVITKASLTNGAVANGHLNGKSVTNGYHVNRDDDTLQQLTKLNHSGYGTSDIVSWNNTPTNMNRDVDNDKYDERNRQMDDDEQEMDAGRTKKIKYGNNRAPAPQQTKLPNPFQEQQNSQNQNGNFRPSYYDNRGQNGDNRLNHNGNGNGYNRDRYHPQNSGHNNFKRGGGGNFRGGYNNKSRDYGYQNGNRQNGSQFGNKRFFNRR